MDNFYVANFLGQLVALLVWSIIASLIFTSLIRFATKVLAKFSPPYFTAFKAALSGTLVSSLLGYSIWYSIGLVGKDISGLGYIIIACIGGAIYSAFLNHFIKKPDGSSIGFNLAVLVTVVQSTTIIVIGAGFYVFLLLLVE